LGSNILAAESTGDRNKSCTCMMALRSVVAYSSIA